uniref:type I protein arginine methyltransferase n=1 Tax=Globodera pallida TaxID=36090 RepID=A0A183CIV4_GLOPA
MDKQSQDELLLNDRNDNNNNNQYKDRTNSVDCTQCFNVSLVNNPFKDMCNRMAQHFLVTESHVRQIQQIVAENRAGARIYVTFGNVRLFRRILLEMGEMGLMQNGEYALVYLDTDYNWLNVYHTMNDISFGMNAQRTCHVHGVASWFDVEFVGLKCTVWLSTAPTEPLTHWYQVRCLVKQPMLVLAGQDVRGRLEMVANDKQSYDMELEMCIEGNESRVWQRNVLDLKMPHFRYTGQPTAGPPGTQPECPSDQLNQAINLFGAGDGGMDQEQQQQHQQQMSALERQQHFACQADQPLQNGFDPRLSVTEQHKLTPNDS